MFTDRITEKKGPDLTAPEAALALAMLTGFTDDVITEEEAAAVRKYFLRETVDSFEQKLKAAGIHFPQNLSAIEAEILDRLKDEPELFRLRAVAVAQIIAEADGSTEREELAAIARFGSELGVSLSEADRFAEGRLVEIDERGDYYRTREGEEALRINLDLSPDEAALLASAVVGFSDGELSEAETAVARDHFSDITLNHLTEKMGREGLSFPKDAVRLRAMIPAFLGRLSRESQLKALAVARKTAAADGGIGTEEAAVLKIWCEELAIGTKEVQNYF